MRAWVGDGVCDPACYEAKACNKDAGDCNGVPDPTTLKAASIDPIPAPLPDDKLSECHYLHVHGAVSGALPYIGRLDVSGWYAMLDESAARAVEAMDGHWGASEAARRNASSADPTTVVFAGQRPINLGFHRNRLMTVRSPSRRLYLSYCALTRQWRLSSSRLSSAVRCGVPFKAYRDAPEMVADGEGGLEEWGLLGGGWRAKNLSEPNSMAVIGAEQLKIDCYEIRKNVCAFPKDPNPSVLQLATSNKSDLSPYFFGTFRHHLLSCPSDHYTFTGATEAVCLPDGKWRQVGAKRGDPWPPVCKGDCLPGEWEDWNCSKPCEGGSRNRTRPVKWKASGGGKDCKAEELIEIKPCHEVPCPVDCEVSSWSEWGDWSHRCGPSERSRHRTIKVKPLHGGKECPDLIGKESKDMKPCKQICILDECSPGVKKRIAVYFQSPLTHGGWEKWCDIPAMSFLPDRCYYLTNPQTREEMDASPTPSPWIYYYAIEEGFDGYVFTPEDGADTVLSCGEGFRMPMKQTTETLDSEEDGWPFVIRLKCPTT
ncbi:unnamed protein product [Vitrella brassicaformis CCMP3155]|uniref:Spondin-like TSP1 domain-containing protein n=1 Tax=Vitrella brassicaformis (strain CCMP3155) TaxID=1169540 RepID=A0A0G4F2J9_VITBC|nr:unnamed protein product [Vitrella brassicaformis CCMP3155]|eukprot:CEM06428.1 unnamed protein product [Vitrella brassicaformis CCMP3155]